MTRSTSLMKRFPFISALVTTAFAAGTGVVDARTYDTIQGRPCFRSMGGMLDSMRDLARDHPDLVRVSTIGESYLRNQEGRPFGRYDIPEGGYDIYVVEVTDPNSPRASTEKGKMLVTSGVHAREWAPPELLARFLESLVRGYNEDADATWILKHTEVHAVLYVNPDGRFMAEEYPELYWRKNMNPDGGCGDDRDYGTDVNRNFDFKWGDRAGASDDPCASDYHGRSPESEPETKALADYARRLFPEGQRKRNPEGQMDVPFSEDNTGMYVDVHSSGGYVYYPWGHLDAKSPNDEALQALGRKVHSFNGYKLWAGSQPDFVYEASGDTSDYMYAVLGVSSMGFEIGDDFQQRCESFEDEVVPNNLPALVYAAKIAGRPFREVKGPDVLDLEAAYVDGEIRVTARASDDAMVNDIRGFPDFRTGEQDLERVTVYLDVHPDDAGAGDAGWAMRPAGGRRLDAEDGDAVAATRAVNCSSITKKKKCNRAGNLGRRGTCEWNKSARTCAPVESDAGDGGGSTGNGSPGDGDSSGVGGSTGGGSAGTGGTVDFDSGDEIVEATIDASGLPPGRHLVYVRATDSDGYDGPVSAAFVEVPRRRRKSSLRGAGSFD